MDGFTDSFRGMVHAAQWGLPNTHIPLQFSQIEISPGVGLHATFLTEFDLWCKPFYSLTLGVCTRQGKLKKKEGGETNESHKRTVCIWRNNKGCVNLAQSRKRWRGGLGNAGGAMAVAEERHCSGTSNKTGWVGNMVGHQFKFLNSLIQKCMLFPMKTVV